MLGLYRDLYRGFTVKHFHERLLKRHNYVLGYTVTKLHLHRAGLVQAAKKRSAHRKKRPRRPMVGMMLHQDASTHAWLPGDERKYDLVVTMEDATSALYSAFLVHEESTASSFRGLREVVGKHGLFCSLYSDRGSHYFFTLEAGGKVSKTVLTQVGRALQPRSTLNYYSAAGITTAHWIASTMRSTPNIKRWGTEKPVLPAAVIDSQSVKSAEKERPRLTRTAMMPARRLRARSASSS